MLREFIDRIQELVHAGQQLDTAADAQIVGADVRIEDLERFHATRRRFRGTFATSVIADFVAYCEDNEVQAVFVDHEKAAAEAFFDLGTKDSPGHCEHRAKLILEATAPYQAWVDICNKDRGQRELRDFVADWLDYIEGGEVLYRALTSVTVEALANATAKVQQFSERRTAMEEYNVTAGATLPEVVMFSCQPYPEFEPYEFTARLHARVLDNSKGVAFLLKRTKSVEESQHLGQDFAAKLSDALPKARVGKFSI